VTTIGDQRDHISNSTIAIAITIQDMIVMHLTVVRHEVRLNTEMMEMDHHQGMGHEDIHVDRTQMENVTMADHLAESIQETKLIPHRTVVGGVAE